MRRFQRHYGAGDRVRIKPGLLRTQNGQPHVGFLSRCYSDPKTGAARLWLNAGMPAVGSYTFQLGFHVLVGLAMAVFYGFVLERSLPGSAWIKGLTFAALTWVANATVVLPWIGEGFAGSHGLGLAGMAYFAAAHTVFFVLLAILFARLTRHRQSRSGVATRQDVMGRW